MANDTVNEIIPVGTYTKYHAGEIIDPNKQNLHDETFRVAINQLGVWIGGLSSGGVEAVYPLLTDLPAPTLPSLQLYTRALVIDNRVNESDPANGVQPSDYFYRVYTLFPLVTVTGSSRQWVVSQPCALAQSSNRVGFFDPANIELDPAHANKILQVGLDGVVEYVPKPTGSLDTSFVYRYATQDAWEHRDLAKVGDMGYIIDDGQTPTSYGRLQIQVADHTEASFLTAPEIKALIADGPGGGATFKNDKHVVDLYAGVTEDSTDTDTLPLVADVKNLHYTENVRGIVAGNNVSIIANPVTKILTVSASGGGGGSATFATGEATDTISLDLQTPADTHLLGRLQAGGLFANRLALSNVTFPVVPGKNYLGVDETGHVTQLVPGGETPTQDNIYPIDKLIIQAGDYITIVPDDTNHRLVVSISRGVLNFGSGEALSSTFIGDAQPTELQTKATVDGKTALKLDRTFANASLPSTYTNKGLKWNGTTFEPQEFGSGGTGVYYDNDLLPRVNLLVSGPPSKNQPYVIVEAQKIIQEIETRLAPKLDTATFNEHIQTQYNPLKALVQDHTTELENLTTNKLDRTFNNALLPSAFNNKGLKWTGTTFEPQAFGSAPTHDNTWEIFKEVFKPDISRAEGCVTVDETNKTLSYRPCISQLEEQIQEIQTGLQGVSFSPPPGKRYLAVGVNNLLTYETAVKAVTLDNTYPVIKEMVTAGSNISFRLQDDTHHLTINADDPVFADGQSVSDYEPIGDGTQLVAMNQFDETATGKFLKKVEQGWGFADIIFKTLEKISETGIGNDEDTYLQRKSDVVSKVSALDNKLTPKINDNQTEISNLKTNKLNRTGYTTAQEGFIAVVRNGVLVMESVDFLTPDYIIKHLPQQFFEDAFDEQLRGSFNARGVYQADDFILDAPLELHDVSDFVFQGLTFNIRVVRRAIENFYDETGGVIGTNNGVLVVNCVVSTGQLTQTYDNVKLSGFAPNLTLTRTNFQQHTREETRRVRLGNKWVNKLFLFIEEPVTHIAEDLFYNNPNTKDYYTLEFPKTLHHILTNAFYDLRLAGNLLFPANLKTIGVNAFFNTTTATLQFNSAGSLLQSLNTGAFDNWSGPGSQAQIIFSSKHLKLIGERAFYSAPLTSINFTSKVPTTCGAITFGNECFHSIPLNPKSNAIKPKEWRDRFFACADWRNAFR